MDLSKNGMLLRSLRKGKGLTQKDVADRLGIVPKTVSKWETGHGFPDVSMISALADILGVCERILLSGDLTKNKIDSGNMCRMKFYVCEYCGSVAQTTGDCQIVCCGKRVERLCAQPASGEHGVRISEIENDFYIEFDHEMSKEHYIRFLAYVGVDRVLTVRLYPEQEGAVRIPKFYGGKIVFACSKHGLFEWKSKRK